MGAICSGFSFLTYTGLDADAMSYVLVAMEDEVMLFRVIYLVQLSDT